MTLDSSDNHDLARIVAGPLYFGMGVNVIGPGALLLVCHFLNQRYTVDNIVGDWANILFYFFCALGMTLAVGALLLARSKLKQPLVRGRETFEQDIIAGLKEISRPVFLIIASIAILGPVYFFLTGRFQEAVFFVVASFVIFQIVRPRYGSVRKLIRMQKELVDQGRFLNQ